MECVQELLSNLWFVVLYIRNCTLLAAHKVCDIRAAQPHIHSYSNKCCVTPYYAIEHVSMQWLFFLVSLESIKNKTILVHAGLPITAKWPLRRIINRYFQSRWSIFAQKLIKSWQSVRCALTPYCIHTIQTSGRNIRMQSFELRTTARVDCGY